MTHPETWEAVCREALYHVLLCLVADVEESTRPVADTVYWGGDPDPEQVERLRRISFEFEYAVEAYLAALCDATEPWGGGDARAPPWEAGTDAVDGEAGDGNDDGVTDAEAPDDADAEESGDGTDAEDPGGDADAEDSEDEDSGDAATGERSEE
jgi:hypothetical protein